MWWYRNVFFKTLRDRGRTTLIVTAAMFATGLYVALLFPEFGANASMGQLIEQLPDWWQDLIGDAVQFATPEGFFTTQPYSFLGAVIMIAFAISLVQAAIAGEEDANTLDQLIANPVSRSTVYFHMALSIIAALTFPVVAVAMALMIGATVRNYSFSYAGLASQSVSLWLLSLTVAAIALAVGASSGSKGQAIAIAAVVSGIGYLLNLVAPLIDWMEPMQYVSIVYYYIGGSPFIHGLIPWHATVLVILSALSTGAGALAFNRRDLR